MNSEIENTETLVFKEKMQALQAVPVLTRIDPTGMVRLAVSDFDGFDGHFEALPYLTIHMCTKHIARIRRVGVKQHLEGVMRPGTIGIAMPNSQAEGYWTKMQMLVIGVDLNRLLFQTQENKIDINRLNASASTLHNDPLLTSVMTSLWRDAEAHGLSTPFFEQGLMLILRRLSDYKPKGISYRAIRPLKGQRLQNVLSLMEERIGQNIQLTELAKLSGQDKSSFSRSFQDATGHTPYEYFILRRIEHAKKLLHTTMSITDIAFSVGYTNPSKFSATFRKVVGNTPSQWRKSHLILTNKLN
jgi:AraC family transcriptional regulator